MLRACVRTSSRKFAREEGKEGRGTTNGLWALQLPTHQPKFPLLALIVSGGHTQLALFCRSWRLCPTRASPRRRGRRGPSTKSPDYQASLPWRRQHQQARSAGDAQAFAFPKAILPCPPTVATQVNTPVTTESSATIRGGRGETFRSRPLSPLRFSHFPA